MRLGSSRKLTAKIRSGSRAEVDVQEAQSEWNRQAAIVDPNQQTADADASGNNKIHRERGTSGYCTGSVFPQASVLSCTILTEQKYCYASRLAGNGSKRLCKLYQISAKSKIVI